MFKIAEDYVHNHLIVLIIPLKENFWCRWCNELAPPTFIQPGHTLRAVHCSTQELNHLLLSETYLAPPPLCGEIKKLNPLRQLPEYDPAFWILFINFPQIPRNYFQNYLNYFLNLFKLFSKSLNYILQILWNHLSNLWNFHIL